MKDLLRTGLPHLQTPENLASSPIPQKTRGEHHKTCHEVSHGQKLLGVKKMCKRFLAFLATTGPWARPCPHPNCFSLGALPVHSVVSPLVPAQM